MISSFIALIIDINRQITLNASCTTISRFVFWVLFPPEIAV